jgi:glycosyltransferase involved in cell wall biosynthesis
LDLVVEAARRLRGAGCSFRLKIIGDGPERARLETTVNSLGLNPQVGFKGYLRGEALEKELEEVAVVVMPSIWEEAAGLAAIEHMMRGRMVIATDTGGLGELVDGTGLKFPMGDIDSLTLCMMRVIDQPNLVKALGEKSGERAQSSFCEKRMVAEHLTLYSELAEASDAEG